jgi:DNA-binding PadR family transcriptional regulator
LAANYSHKHFFRQVPNHQLANYFSAKVIDFGVDLSGLKEKEVDAIFIAFTALPEDQQAMIEAEFQDIYAMACEAGITALIDEAVFYDDETFAEDISNIEGFHAKVMWAYLNRHDYWMGATMFLHADNVSHSYWKRRNDLPHVPPNVDKISIKALATSISDYFHSKEGRGRNCLVEVYRRHDKEYFFAYPEDFGLSSVEWVSDALKTRARHPAFEIIFVYCESEGSLDIYALKNAKAVPELQKLFAKTILNIDSLKSGELDKRVYDLNPIGDAEFKFTIDPESGIDEILVTQLRLTLKHGSKRRITLEADTKSNSQAVYNLLAELNPPAYYVTQTRIKVIFEPKIGERTKTKTFNITHPNSCALGHEGNDLKIRQMLAKSGIEPQAEQQ